MKIRSCSPSASGKWRVVAFLIHLQQKALFHLLNDTLVHLWIIWFEYGKFSSIAATIEIKREKKRARCNEIAFFTSKEKFYNDSKPEMVFYSSYWNRQRDWVLEWRACLQYQAFLGEKGWENSRERLQASSPLRDSIFPLFPKKRLMLRLKGNKEVRYLIVCKWISPGGTPGNSWWGCAARFFKSWPDFRPKNVIFHTRFQTRPLKSIPVFRPGL